MTQAETAAQATPHHAGALVLVFPVRLSNHPNAPTKTHTARARFSFPIRGRPMVSGRHSAVLSHHMRACLLALGVLLALPTFASAQGVAVDLYRAAETPQGGFAVSRPNDQGHLNLSVQLHADYALAPLVLTDRPGGGDPPRLVSDLLGLRAGIAFGLIDRLVIFGSLPVIALMEGQNFPGAGVPNADGAGIGDPDLGARVRLLGEASEMGALALQLTGTIPLAEAVDENQNLSGESAAAFSPELLGELRFAPVEITGNLGFRFRAQTDFTRLQIGHELTWGIGVGVRFLEEMLEARLEAFGSVGLTDPSLAANNPAETLLGLRVHPLDGLAIGLAGGIGLGTGYGTPIFRGVFSIGWTDTSDHERRAAGRSWDAPEPVEGRAAAGTRQGSERSPENGTATDGTATDSTAIDGTATDGTATDGAATDGTTADSTATDGAATDGTDTQEPDGPRSASAVARPDYEAIDRDGDRIVDAQDRCPLDREDYDEIQDEDGCPEEDADNDQLADEDDRCPLTPGPQRRGDCAGCPALACVSTSSGQIEITQRVEFETNEATILERSEAVLNDVLSIVSNNTQILRLRIEGHTDGRGDAADNLALSQRRAAAVVAWLVERGVERERLVGFGCGERHLVGADRTRIGRQRNRRVEFLIIEPASSREIYGDCAPADSTAASAPASE